ncbi:zf-TFIIB domain-containing protein [Paenibacillus sepulcri]|uniref:Zf-TFIIB domain-containing protein n=1 Tax=Paenibacillus sepulcri TaxID=359917 RepID=A0ABS7C0E5_9BACL|nr:zf-TFIIB domain-containing protein [Paenibacillus sepulcri]
MKCPVCDDARMREVEKNGVVIDVCPECKGVWLDRGELDKLTNGIREVRSEYDRLERQVSYDNQDSRGYRQDDHSNDAYGSRGYDKNGKPYKKKKNMMDVFGDLFE